MGSRKKVILLMAVPLRGGGKGLAIKKKNIYFLIIFILLPFKNNKNFTLDKLSTYGHITLKFVGRYL